MKRIINGQLYNTETSDAVMEVSAEGVARSDFAYWEETLYRTEKGAYFLVGFGGALSQYGITTVEGARYGGERLTSLPSKAEVLQWWERHGLDADELPAELLPDEA